MPVKDLCRKHGFSDASYYLWRSKYGGMSVSDAKRLKELETENIRLKKLLAESLLENEVTHEDSAVVGRHRTVAGPVPVSRTNAVLFATVCSGHHPARSSQLYLKRCVR